MDTASFDRLARQFSARRARRPLVGSLTALSLGLAGTSATPPIEAKKRKKKCKKKSEVCKGKCGKVTYKCRKRKKKANCGSCCDVCPSGCAFAAANPGDTIDVCCGTYTENLQIAKNLTIVGNCSPSPPALQGTGANRVINVSAGTVSLPGLLITGGAGGIANSATLEMIDCTVSGNDALSQGGGIANIAALTLGGCTISGNTAGSSGGGIANNGGTVALEDGTIVTGNQAGASGGGIYNNGPINTGGPGISTCSGGSSVSGNTPNNCVAFGGGSCDGC